LVDLAAYEAFLSGQLTNYALPEEEIRRALQTIEQFPKP
jgi:tryptophan synthase beta chain